MQRGRYSYDNFVWRRHLIQKLVVHEIQFLKLEARISLGSRHRQQIDAFVGLETEVQGDFGYHVR